MGSSGEAEQGGVAYCVRAGHHPPPPPGLTGVDGHPVRLVEEAGLALWFSDGSPSEPTVERIRAHDAVVRAALRTATPLPFRFGTRLRGEPQARAMLRENRERFAQALQRVEGRVEMGVRALWTDGSAPAPPPEELPVRSGRDYMEALRRRHLQQRHSRERADQLLDRLEAVFAPVSPVSHRIATPEPGVAGVVAHLVQRESLHQYRRCADEAANLLGEVELHFSGPWAPYSFV